MTRRQPKSAESGTPRAELIANIDRLVGYIRSAARLRLEIAPFLSDRKSKKDGITVHFAVDTNLLQLYLNPSKTGPRSKGGGGGYGVVFDDDDDDSARTLGAAISRFVFYNLTGQRPLIMLPGHHVEARTIYEAIFQRAADAKDQASNERDALKLNLENLASITENKERAKWVETNAPELFSYLFLDVGPRAELRRFNRLMSDGRIMRLETAITQSQFYGDDSDANKRSRNAFSVPYELSHMFEEGAYRQEWTKRLKEANPKRPKHRRRFDAAALARLELINRHSDKTPHRLLLITGDKAMFQAAQHYQPNLGSSVDFASAYLRHPRAFLAAPEVLRAHKHNARDKENFAPLHLWLDALLTRYTGDRPQDEVALNKIVSGDEETQANIRDYVGDALRGDKAAANIIKKEWVKHKSDLMEAHATVSDIARAEIERVFGRAVDSNVYDLLEKLDDRLYEENEATWNDFLVAMLRTGHDLLINIEEHKRSPPPISFGSYNSASSLVRLILGSSGSRELTPAMFASMLGNIDDDGGTGYTKTLAFAVLFARSGRWEFAKQISKRAVEIAENNKSKIVECEKLGQKIDDDRRSISGREAYYFKAVAHRLTARSVVDLDEVESFLAQAEDALANQEERSQKSKPSTLRFDAERLALKLSRHLFLRFGKQEISAAADEISKSGLFSEFLELLGQTSIEDDSWIRYNIERRLFTNMFMVAAVMETAGALDDLTTAACCEKAGQFREQISHPPPEIGVTIPVTRLVDTVADYASARFSRLDKRQKKRISANLGKLEIDMENNPSKVVAMPYDRQRFDMLLNLTRKALQSKT